MTLERYVGEGAYGATFAEPEAGIRASVQQTASFTTEWKDDEVIIDTLILVRPEVGPVTAGSKVIIGPDTFIVVKAFAIPDEFRPSHYELAVKSWGYVQ